MVRRSFFQRLAALPLLLFGGSFIVKAGERPDNRLLLLTTWGPSNDCGMVLDECDAEYNTVRATEWMSLPAPPPYRKAS